MKIYIPVLKLLLLKNEIISLDLEFNSIKLYFS